MRLRYLACVFALLITARSGLAKERSPDEYRALFQQWTSRLAQVQKADQSRSALSELEQIRTLIGQAQAFLANDKLDEIEPIAEHAEVLLGFAANKVERVNSAAAADAAEAKAKALETKAISLRAEADAAQKRYDELESQGL